MSSRQDRLPESKSLELGTRWKSGIGPVTGKEYSAEVKALDYFSGPGWRLLGETEREKKASTLAIGRLIHPHFEALGETSALVGGQHPRHSRPGIRGGVGMCVARCRRACERVNVPRSAKYSCTGQQ